MGKVEEDKERLIHELHDPKMKDKEGKEKIKDSKFYQVLEKAFEKIGKKKEFEEAWKK